MLRKEDAVETDLYVAGKSQSKVYIFNCRTCGEPKVRARANKLETHGGQCSDCAIGDRRLRPYESTYNVMCERHHKKHMVGELVCYEDFLKFTQTKHCHYCNRPIKWSEYANSSKRDGRSVNLDRIDSDTGYCEGNLVVCCWSCNFVRQDVIPYEAMLKIGPILSEYGVEGRKQGRESFSKDKITPKERAVIAARKSASTNKTGFRGVYWNKAKSKWMAQIKIAGKNTHLGYFDTQEDAARKFDSKAIELYGNAATLNFPQK